MLLRAGQQLAASRTKEVKTTLNVKINTPYLRCAGAGVQAAAAWSIEGGNANMQIQCPQLRYFSNVTT